MKEQIKKKKQKQQELSKVDGISFLIPINNVRWFQFLHILANPWYGHSGECVVISHYGLN